jgi:hypothetical protein
MVKQGTGIIWVSPHDDLDASEAERRYTLEDIQDAATLPYHHLVSRHRSDQSTQKDSNSPRSSPVTHVLS